MTRPADLTASLAWWEAIFERSPIGMAVFDRDLRFVRINAALATLNGLPEEHHLGRHLEEVLQGTGPELALVYRHVLATGQQVTQHPVSAFWLGYTRHAVIDVYPVVVDGEIAGVVGLVQNVGRAHRIERAHALLARTSQLIEVGDDPSMMAQAIADLFVPDFADWSDVRLWEQGGGLAPLAVSDGDAGRGARTRNVLGDAGPARLRRWLGPVDASPPWVEEQVPTSAWARLAAGDPAWERSLRSLDIGSCAAVPLAIRSRVYGVVHLHMALGGRVLRAEDLPLFGEAARRAAHALDRSRLERLARTEQRRADEASRAKDEFIGVVSHELRNPLNAILGWAQIGLQDETGSNRAKALEVIHRNAKAQAELIDDLLDATRVISGKLTLDPCRVDVRELVGAAVDAAVPAARAKSIGLELDGSDVPPIWGDPARLRQAVFNVLGNAVKFTEAGGHVRVHVRGDEANIVVTVTDDGRGIAPELLPRVFDRFQQGHAGSGRRESGLGLGLGVARHIVELHGGTIAAQSAGVGRGSEFTLTIPVVEPSGLDPCPAAPEAGPRLDGVRVLLVDDESDTREILSRMLTDRGAFVLDATSGEAALERLGDHVDVLVADIAMPGMDGFELIRRVRAGGGSFRSRVPAIALTAMARRQDGERAIAAGFDAHLAKPFDLDIVVRQIRDLVVAP